MYIHGKPGSEKALQGRIRAIRRRAFGGFVDCSVGLRFYCGASACPSASESTRPGSGRTGEGREKGARWSSLWCCAGWRFRPVSYLCCRCCRCCRAGSTSCPPSTTTSHGLGAWHRGLSMLHPAPRPAKVGQDALDGSKRPFSDVMFPSSASCRSAPQAMADPGSLEMAPSPAVSRKASQRRRTRPDAG